MTLRKMMATMALLSAAFSAQAAPAPKAPAANTFAPSQKSQDAYMACKSMKMENFNEGSSFDCDNHLHIAAEPSAPARPAQAKPAPIARPPMAYLTPNKFAPTQKNMDAYKACVKIENFSEGSSFDCENHLRSSAPAATKASASSPAKAAKPMMAYLVPNKFAPTQKSMDAYKACVKMEAHQGEGSHFDCGNHLRQPAKERPYGED